MAARLKNNRPSVFGYHVQCSSGPSHKSLDLNHYGGLLICRLWSIYLEGYLLEQEKK